MLCWIIALCLLWEENVSSKSQKTACHLYRCWPGLTSFSFWDLVISQHKVMQPQAMKMWGFSGLAAYQQLRLMHEWEQVTYSQYCVESFVVHALGTRKHYFFWKYSVCILLFWATFFWGVCGGNTERDSIIFKAVVLQQAFQSWAKFSRALCVLE